MTEKQTVLIVEDTPEHIEILVHALRDDYVLRVALEGESALHQANLEPRPDLILLDIVMPGIDGYAVCEKLKAMPGTRNIPVVFTTARGAEGDEYRGFQVGAADYISKPFNPELVKARVRNHIELKKHRDHLEELVREQIRELELTRNATIFGLGILAEFRDTETGQHIKRTQDYVRLLSTRLRTSPRFRGFFDAETSRLLVSSAPLHDIGKVGVSDLILHKPGPLDAAEFEQMKQHTLYGRNVIDRVEQAMHDTTASAFLRIAKDVTYTHHERWDGSGYHGMRGDEIPVAGRLMALADIYDALISKRVYKQAMPHEDAVRTIVEGDGRTRPEHFDPDVLSAFVELEKDFRIVSETWKDQ